MTERMTSRIATRRGSAFGAAAGMRWSRRVLFGVALASLVSLSALADARRDLLKDLVALRNAIEAGVSQGDFRARASSLRQTTDRLESERAALEEETRSEARATSALALAIVEAWAKTSDPACRDKLSKESISLPPGHDGGACAAPIRTAFEAAGLKDQWTRAMKERNGRSLVQDLLGELLAALHRRVDAAIYAARGRPAGSR